MADQLSRRSINGPADGFPIPVERLDEHTARLLACNVCGRCRPATTDEIGMSDALGFCPDRCGGWLEWAYEEADKCPGCGKLGWFRVALRSTDVEPLNGACSRVCMLQAEYAASLKETA